MDDIRLKIQERLNKYQIRYGDKPKIISLDITEYTQFLKSINPDLKYLFTPKTFSCLLKNKNLTFDNIPVMLSNKICELTGFI